MAATLDFTSFFTMAFLEAAPFFTAWLFLIRYIYILYLGYNNIHLANQTVNKVVAFIQVKMTYVKGDGQ